MTLTKKILEHGKLLGQSWVSPKKFYCNDGYKAADYSIKGKKQMIFAYFHRGGGPIE